MKASNLPFDAHAIQLFFAGLYYYSARLAPQGYKGVAGFMTAHCNLFGVLTSIAYLVMELAWLIANMRYAATYDSSQGKHKSSEHESICINNQTI